MAARPAPLALVVLVAAAACGGATEPPPRPEGPGPRIDGSAEPDAPPPLPAGTSSIACTSDADCGGLACGPCEEGAPITDEYRRRECLVNPCPDAVAVCAPDHRCRVGSRAGKK